MTKQLIETSKFLSYVLRHPLAESWIGHLSSRS